MYFESPALQIFWLKACSFSFPYLLALQDVQPRPRRVLQARAAWSQPSRAWGPLANHVGAAEGCSKLLKSTFSPYSNSQVSFQLLITSPAISKRWRDDTARTWVFPSGSSLLAISVSFRLGLPQEKPKCLPAILFLPFLLYKARFGVVLLSLFFKKKYNFSSH